MRDLTNSLLQRYCQNFWLVSIYCSTSKSYYVQTYSWEIWHAFQPAYNVMDFWRYVSQFQSAQGVNVFWEFFWIPQFDRCFDRPMHVLLCWKRHLHDLLKYLLPSKYSYREMKLKSQAWMSSIKYSRFLTKISCQFQVEVALKSDGNWYQVSFLKLTRHFPPKIEIWEECTCSERLYIVLQSIFLV